MVILGGGAACTILPGELGRGEEGTAPRSAADAMAGVPPLYQPTFRTLADAVEGSDDELAWRLLETLRGRELGVQGERLFESFERILTGRRIVRSLRLSLFSEPLERPGSYRLSLRAEHTGDQLLTLKLPPADLERLRTAVNKSGTEQREADNRISYVFDELELAPGSRREIELVTHTLPLGSALAVRERWVLRPRSGEVHRAGRAYPAARVLVVPCERIRLSEHVDQAPLAPDELVDFVHGHAEASKEELLQKAVRIEPARRDEALLRLAPLVDTWARETPERVITLAPALRWLARTARPGEEPTAWSSFLQRRREQVEPRERSRLELP